MFTRFFSALVACLFASQLGADVQQPLSVQPIKSSVSALYSGVDILARKYNPLEHQWRVARLPKPYRQPNPKIPMDDLEQLINLQADDQTDRDLRPMPVDESSQITPKASAAASPAPDSAIGQSTVNCHQPGLNGSCRSSYSSCQPGCTR